MGGKREEAAVMVVAGVTEVGAETVAAGEMEAEVAQRVVAAKAAVAE